MGLARLVEKIPRHNFRFISPSRSLQYFPERFPFLIIGCINQTNSVIEASADNRALLFERRLRIVAQLLDE
jgi:hypothetical protein